MNVYDVETVYTQCQTHCVVAENMAEAERIFMGKYRPVTIKNICLHSKYVQIQNYDEQLRG